jgi:hypothetical protein
MDVNDTLAIAFGTLLTLYDTHMNLHMEKDLFSETFIGKLNSQTRRWYSMHVNDTLTIASESSAHALRHLEIYMWKRTNSG